MEEERVLAGFRFKVAIGKGQDEAVREAIGDSAGGWRWALSSAGSSRVLRASWAVGFCNQQPSARPLLFRSGFPSSPAPGFKQESRQQSLLASPPTSHPSPPSPPTAYFRRRLRSSACTPDVASSAVSSSSPIPAWDWEPRVPNPSEARGNERSDRRCRASLRPALSPSARSTATSLWRRHCPTTEPRTHTGMVFSPIPFQPDALPPIREPPAAEQPESTENVPAAGVTSTISEFFKRLIFPPLNPNLLQELDIQKISWNPHKHCLAFVSWKNQVIVHDFEDSDAKEPFILTSDQQTNVKAVEWRPNSGKMIAVACKGGICLWSASYPGDVPFMKAGVTPYSFSAFPRGSGGRWILVDVLRDSSAEQVSALCWKPDGRYLASASCNSPSFTIWDVSQGLGTPIRRGLSNISLLRWSPSGDYLLAAKFDGTFHFWETNTWTSEPWSSSNGYVSGANWDPEGRVALVSFSNSTTLGSIHFSSKPLSLDAHLLPVELPEISSLIVSRGIEKLAWDASGERLALSFKDGNEMYRGLVAVYDVRRSPLVSVSLVGFIRGPGEGAKPLAFAFHSKFKQGPLLSVCWSSGWCCTYPLILRSH